MVIDTFLMSFSRQLQGFKHVWKSRNRIIPLKRSYSTNGLNPLESPNKRNYIGFAISLLTFSMAAVFICPNKQEYFNKWNKNFNDWKNQHWFKDKPRYYKQSTPVALPEHIHETPPDIEVENEQKEPQPEPEPVSDILLDAQEFASILHMQDHSAPPAIELELDEVEMPIIDQDIDVEESKTVNSNIAFDEFTIPGDITIFSPHVDKSQHETPSSIIDSQSDNDDHDLGETEKSDTKYAFEYPAEIDMPEDIQVIDTEGISLAIPVISKNNVDINVEEPNMPELSKAEPENFVLETNDTIKFQEQVENMKPLPHINAEHEPAFDPNTGEINWDSPTLGGLAHGRCSDEFKMAFSCFVHSQTIPKGTDCIERFNKMQECFKSYPDFYSERANNLDINNTPNI